MFVGCAFLLDLIQPQMFSVDGQCSDFKGENKNNISKANSNRGHWVTQCNFARGIGTDTSRTKLSQSLEYLWDLALPRIFEGIQRVDQDPAAGAEALGGSTKELKLMAEEEETTMKKTEEFELLLAMR